MNSPILNFTGFVPVVGDTDNDLIVYKKKKNIRNNFKNIRLEKNYSSPKDRLDNLEFFFFSVGTCKENYMSPKGIYLSK